MIGCLGWNSFFRAVYEVLHYVHFILIQMRQKDSKFDSFVGLSRSKQNHDWSFPEHSLTQLMARSHRQWDQTSSWADRSSAAWTPGRPRRQRIASRWSMLAMPPSRLCAGRSSHCEVSTISSITHRKILRVITKCGVRFASLWEGFIWTMPASSRSVLRDSHALWTSSTNAGVRLASRTVPTSSNLAACAPQMAGSYVTRQRRNGTSRDVPRAGCDAACSLRQELNGLLLSNQGCLNSFSS